MNKMTVPARLQLDDTVEFDYIDRHGKKTEKRLGKIIKVELIEKTEVMYNVDIGNGEYRNFYESQMMNVKKNPHFKVGDEVEFLYKEDDRFIKYYGKVEERIPTEDEEVYLIHTHKEEKKGFHGSRMFDVKVLVS